MQKKYKSLVIAGLIVIVGVVALVTSSLVQAAEGRDCDDNAIVRCGVYSLTELRDKYTGDVPAVFAHYGVSGAEVKGTSGTVKSGYVTKSGKVLVGGEVVATGAVTVGRQDMPGSKSVTIDGKTYYERTPSVSFLSDQLEAYVFFDANGVFSGAVLKSCGNPVTGNPEAQPSAVCKALTKNVIARNKFSFDAEATVKDGATVTGYVFTVQDGADKIVETKTVTTSALQAHSGEMTFDKADTYVAKVVVKTSVGDRTSADCAVAFTVTPEEKPSLTIDKKVNNVERTLIGTDEVFTYQIRVINNGNVDVNGAVVSDTQPDGVTFVKASEGKIVNGTWTAMVSLKAGAYHDFTITAKVPSYKAGDIKNTACVKADTVNNGAKQCDDAVVYVKPPVINMIWVCELKTKDIIKIKESDFDATKYSKDLSKCKDNPKPDMMWVCVLETKDIKQIKKSEFDSTKYSQELNDCRQTITMVPVCDATTGKLITVNENEAGNYKPVDDEACTGHVLTTSTKDLPSTGPADTLLSGLVGSSALGLGVTSYVRSRSAVRGALKK